MATLLSQTESMGESLIDRDLARQSANDDDELRTSIANGVLDYQVFDAFDDLPMRQQQALMEALRVETDANDATIVRVMRAAFKRVVQEELADHDSRIREEVALFARTEH
jgi:hypothetical protein